jgi:hypothetical protein
MDEIIGDFEIFNDIGYYGMWCVRFAKDRRFCSPMSFHFVKEEDAREFLRLFMLAV